MTTKRSSNMLLPTQQLDVNGTATGVVKVESHLTNILIVDDERTVRELLSKNLKDAGYTCWTAQDAQGARELLQCTQIDLLLSDINMPGESGIELCQFVKNEYPNLPIVIVSVIDDPNAAKELLDLDVYGYIVKPFTRNLVRIAVDNALRRHQLELQSKAYQETLEDKIERQANEMQRQVVFLQNLMDAVPSAMFYLSTKGSLVGCNRSFTRFVGSPREELIGKSMDVIFPEILPAIYKSKQRQPQNYISQKLEIAAMDAAGHERDLLIKKAICTDENGRMAGIVGVMLDRTEQNRMELALRASDQKYSQIIENINLGVALLNPQMEIIQMNRQLRKWFPDIMPNKDCICYQSFQLPPKKGPCENCPVIKTFAEGKSFETTICIEGKQHDRYFRDHSSPIFDEKGNITAAILLIEDVTEKIAMERDLRQAQKLESIGQLAAGIAHEINTPMQYIGDNTGFLQDSFEDLGKALSAFEDLFQAVKSSNVTDSLVERVEKCIREADLPYLSEEIPRAIEQSTEGVTRVNSIVRAMRDFSHPGSDKKSLVNLNQAINNTITVARSEWKYVAEMELDLDPSLPDVRCLPGEINQVLLIIIVNAAHAITDAKEKEKESMGKISISTRKKHDSVAIHIRDTGTGIPKEIQHRIFDLFFTTKSIGKGTGQGLAIAHSVITEKHGGNLRFETQENEGTTFLIELPLTETEKTIEKVSK